MPIFLAPPTPQALLYLMNMIFLFCQNGWFFISLAGFIFINMQWFYLYGKLASLLDMEMSLTGFCFPGSLLEPFLWIGITLTSTSLSGTVAVCKGSLHMLAKTVSPLSYFKTGWWMPSGHHDLSTPGLLIRCRASCLPLFDLVPLTCWVQCCGLGMWISLEDKEFIQSINRLLF